MKSTSERFDAVVVGAGPAGSMAAKTVASGGHRVLLLERNSTVGVSVRCGEAITRAALSNFLEPDGRWIATEVKGALLFSPSGRRAVLEYPQAGYVLERKIFDRELARRACVAGAELKVKSRAVGLEFEENGEITVRARENGHLFVYKAKVVVGADGIQSAVGRWGGIDTSVGLGHALFCVQRLVLSDQIDPGYLEFHFDRGISPGGYAWVFPKGKRTANVGVALLAPANNRKAPTLYLEAFLEKRFKKHVVLEQTVGGIAAYCGKTELQKGRLVLVGDAGRLADPLTYAGIGNALASGRMAGEVINEFLERKTDLGEYPKRWQKWSGRDKKLYSFCQELYAELDNEDFEKIIAAVDKMLGGKVVLGFDKFQIVKEIILGNPRLLGLAGKRLWW
jgi:digeranylgeranylglycerophospholipid reductase